MPPLPATASSVNRSAIRFSPGASRDGPGIFMDEVLLYAFPEQAVYTWPLMEGAPPWSVDVAKAGVQAQELDAARGNRSLFPHNVACADGRSTSSIESSCYNWF